MSDTAYALLRKLLERAERGSDQPLTLNRRSAPEYFAISDPEVRDALHAVLTNAQAAGAVKLEWGKYEAAQDLQRIRLADADRLAAFLGVERAAEQADRLMARLAPLLSDAPEWLREQATAIHERWRIGERPGGLGTEDADGIVLLYRALAAVARDEHRGLDLRRFSARALNDSKAMERMRGHFARIWCDAHGLDLDPEELYAELGLEKFPQPVFVKGPLSLRLGGHGIDVDRVRPFLAVSPDAVEAMQVRSPAYVLTIENLASFQRHVREIDDDGIVLYCAGFPSPAFRAFLARLDATVADEVPFFHWGDVDLGGLRIFARIAGTLARRRLRPHLMTPAEGQGTPFSQRDRLILERMRESGGAAGELAAAWLDAGIGTVEQEAVDPSGPMEH